MEQTDDIEMQLWEYLDDTCTSADRQRIDMLLQNDPEWQKKLGELSALHVTLAGSMELEQPSLRFSKNIMDMVGHTHIAPAAKKYINYTIIRSIAAFFIIAIISVLIYALATTNRATSAPDALSRLYSTPNINFTGFFTSSMFNIIVGINIILGLLLVDAWLRRKRAEHYS